MTIYPPSLIPASTIIKVPDSINTSGSMYRSKAADRPVAPWPRHKPGCSYCGSASQMQLTRESSGYLSLGWKAAHGCVEARVGTCAPACTCAGILVMAY